MRELIIHHRGGWRDEQSIWQMQQFCWAALGAVEDSECMECIKSIQSYASDLFSEFYHHRWARRHMTGADVLRLQILRELEAFYARLVVLELSGVALPVFLPAAHPSA